MHSIILILIIIILFGFILFQQKKLNIKLEQKKNIDQINQAFTSTYQEYQRLTKDYNKKKEDFSQLLIKQQKELRQASVEGFAQINEELDNFRAAALDRTNQELDTFRNQASSAADSYFSSLEQHYSAIEHQYDEKKKKLQDQYLEQEKELQRIKATRQAAYQAFIREKQINAQRKDYCLVPSDEELEDINKLLRLRKNFNKPRVISMLIWSTYYQPLAKKQFPLILGDKTKIGIYKITNQETGQCYIGQARDIYRRWSDHAKAGLGIDTPTGSKLYQAMQEYGLENFSFELIEECPVDSLDAKEAYYISLYNAVEIGYNTLAGTNIRRK